MADMEAKKWQVISELDTIEAYLVLSRAALTGQGPDTGTVGPKAWEDILTDICDRLQDCRETLSTDEE